MKKIKFHRVILKIIYPAGVICTSLCLAIAGCGEKSVAKASSAVEIITPPPTTPEDWKIAIESTYEKTNIKNKGEGVEEFFACFEPTPEKQRKCTNYAFGKRDAFRKLRFYSGLNVMAGNNVAVYVSLPDNSKPVLFLAPHIFSQNSWLFINKFAVMVDGDVVLEQELEHSKIDRETFPGGVEERGDFVATLSQIEALRKIKQESVVLVRITGSKGYITFDKGDASSAKESLMNIVKVYDALDNAVKNKIPSVQPASEN